MGSQEYLERILEQQKLSQNQKKNMRNLRDKIEGHIRDNLSGNPVFYYGGSYGKKTIIKESYDLDIVVYWPKGHKKTLKEIYYNVKKVLDRNWEEVKPKRVALQIPFKGDFHIDVVPGRALDEENKSANLYDRKLDTTLKTSVKTHIDTVRNSGRRPIIKLMKLWKKRKSLDFKTFILEQMVIEGAKGKRKDNYESQLLASFKYIYDNIESSRIIDPANSNNVISDDLTKTSKATIKKKAKKAIRSIEKGAWKELFSKS